ncbi:PIG-L deacetylase family protein [Rhodothermus marinus]|uniref:PIG-L deacetylase family protein n=1 Tax=Rhodothermus marinus TaxID=29549 RepID=UPI000B1D0E73|nr:PIG-L family deacetylase [Rhodothermus marinus]
MVRYARWGLLALLFGAQVAWSQPEVPVEQWQGKTILLIGAHPDDDSYAHGTLARLAAQGNDVYVLLLTMGNVGTKDTTLSRTQLARIRKQEEINALAALGIPADHYINLGYDDGRLEYYATNHREELIRRVVYYIRKLKPDVLFAFDPGKGEQRWHKSDHRAASLLAVDAARAAEWPLLFESHLIYDAWRPTGFRNTSFSTTSPRTRTCAWTSTITSNGRCGRARSISASSARPGTSTPRPFRRKPFRKWSSASGDASAIRTGAP